MLNKSGKCEKKERFTEKEESNENESLRKELRKTQNQVEDLTQKLLQTQLALEEAVKSQKDAGKSLEVRRRLPREVVFSGIAGEKDADYDGVKKSKTLISLADRIPPEETPREKKKTVMALNDLINQKPILKAKTEKKVVVLSELIDQETPKRAQTMKMDFFKMPEVEKVKTLVTLNNLIAETDDKRVSAATVKDSKTINLDTLMDEMVNQRSLARSGVTTVSTERKLDHTENPFSSASRKTRCSHPTDAESEEEFEGEIFDVNSFDGCTDAPVPVLKLRGLPYSVAETGVEDVINWIGKHKKNLHPHRTPPAVLLSKTFTNQFNGFAMLYFKNLKSARNCQKDIHCKDWVQKSGYFRYIEVEGPVDGKDPSLLFAIQNKEPVAPKTTKRNVQSTKTEDAKWRNRKGSGKKKGGPPPGLEFGHLNSYSTNGYDWSGWEHQMRDGSVPSQEMYMPLWVYPREHSLRLSYEGIDRTKWVHHFVTETEKTNNGHFSQLFSRKSSNL